MTTEQIMTLWLENGAWLLSGSLAVALIYAYGRSKAAKLDRRSKQLAAATEALRSHHQAIEQILDAPEPSDELKASLCRFSEAIVEPSFSAFLLHRLRDKRPNLSSGARKLKGEVEGLKDPKVKSAIHKAVETGIAAAVLRWPVPADEYYAIFVELARDDRREIQIAQSAKQFWDSQDGGSTPGGGLPAMA